MKHTEIKTGAYRALFIDALLAYRQTADQAELPVINHYLNLLENPAYKFGVPSYGGGGGGGYTDFFRS